MRTLGMLVMATVALAVGCASEAPADDGGEASEDAVVATPSKHAIVLAHGFDGSRTNRWAFYKVEETLKAKGFVVKAAQVSPYKSVPDRAAQLKQYIDQAQAMCRATTGCDASKVHIIAHSMGGLDSRWLVTKLGYADRVASLTTISTPHRGSHIADVLLKLLPNDHTERAKIVNAAASAWARTFTDADLAQGSDVRGALDWISEKKTAEELSETATKDDPRVTYLSYAGVSNIDGIPNPADYPACENHIETRLGIRDGMNATLAAGAFFVSHADQGELRPNDGMVTVASAKWGKFLGCIPADHLDEVGQPHDDNGHFFTGFNHLTFYIKLASRLDEEVRLHDQARAASAH